MEYNIDSTQLLVLGIGNYLMGDEGIGVHLIQSLQEEQLPENCLLLDGGVGGFHLLEYMQSSRKMIIIDATRDGKEAGTVTKLKPKFSSDYPRTLTAHDVGLKDLLDAFYFSGSDLPDITLFTISIDELPDSLTIDLSDKLKTKFKEIKEIIVKEIYKQIL